MTLKKQEESILEIINSDKFDKEAFMKLKGFCFSYDAKDNIEDVAEILRRQYVDNDIDNILVSHDVDKIIDFLNRLLRSKLAYKNSNRKQYIITPQELEEFRKLATEAEKISKEEFAKTSPLLTTRKYLNMCRIAYDTAFDWKYPEDISTPYLFCEARMLGFNHEYNKGILGVDWDSPEKFALKFSCSYHSEELRFGGPKFYINDESARMGTYGYTLPKTYGQWTGWICCDSDDKRSRYEAIKMYIALRRKGYPIYFSNYNEICVAVKKSCTG